VELLETLRAVPATAAGSGESGLAPVPAGGGEEATSVAHAPGMRIRSDLWRAVMDYASGRKFVWDPAKNAAYPSDDPSASPLLPTVDANLLKEWRAKVAAKHESDRTGDG